MTPLNNQNNDNSALDTWLPYAGELVALATAIRTASTVSERYTFNRDGVSAAATELFAAWFLPSFAARSAVSYIPQSAPYANKFKAVISFITALAMAKKINPHVCYLLYSRYKTCNWGPLSRAAAFSSTVAHALTGKGFF